MDDATDGLARETVKKALDASGINGTYMAWPLGHKEPTPWFAYTLERNDLYADGARYMSYWQVHVDLFESETDAATEQKLEDACSAIGPASRTQTWLQSEKSYVTGFDFTYIPEKK